MFVSQTISTVFKLSEWKCVHIVPIRVRCACQYSFICTCFALLWWRIKDFIYFQYLQVGDMGYAHYAHWWL